MSEVRVVGPHVGACVPVERTRRLLLILGVDRNVGGLRRTRTKSAAALPSRMSTNDRGDSEEACRRAVMASQEFILEKCSGLEGTIEEVGPDAFAFVPEDAKDEFGFDLNSPETDAEIEEAIESCMDSEWSRDWAESVLGPDASTSSRDAAKRRACEGLFS